MKSPAWLRGPATDLPEERAALRGYSRVLTLSGASNFGQVGERALLLQQALKPFAAALFLFRLQAILKPGDVAVRNPLRLYLRDGFSHRRTVG